MTSNTPQFFIDQSSDDIEVLQVKKDGKVTFQSTPRILHADKKFERSSGSQELIMLENEETSSSSDSTPKRSRPSSNDSSESTTPKRPKIFMGQLSNQRVFLKMPCETCRAARQSENEENARLKEQVKTLEQIVEKQTEELGTMIERTSTRLAKCVDVDKNYRTDIQKCIPMFKKIWENNERLKLEVDNQRKKLATGKVELIAQKLKLRAELKEVQKELVSKQNFRHEESLRMQRSFDDLQKFCKNLKEENKEKTEEMILLNVEIDTLQQIRALINSKTPSSQ